MPELPKAACMRDADIKRTVAAIRVGRTAVPPDRALLVAISGIDGAGKGTVARRLAQELEAHGLHAFTIELDAWHELPDIRFDAERTPLHFYRQAFRWDALFRDLIEPLRQTRAIHTTLALTRLPQNDVYPHTYAAEDIDVILLEGIFLLKCELRPRYNLAFWVECSFETALRRAIARNQEGLPVDEIVADYTTIYFPAERIHLERDDPRVAATGIIANDEEDEK